MQTLERQTPLNNILCTCAISRQRLDADITPIKHIPVLGSIQM